MTWVLAAFAGGLGALARFGLSSWVQTHLGTDRPWGTAVVNLTGAAALGFLAGWDALTEGQTLVLAIGFVGGYTTFSTWMVESELLAEGGGVRAASAGALNITGLLLAGVALAAATFVVGRSL